MGATARGATRMSRLSASFFEDLLGRVPFFVAVKGIATRRYVFVNDAFCALLERPRDEILGKHDGELFGEQWAREQRAREDRALAMDEDVAAADVVFATPTQRHIVSLTIARLDPGEGNDPRLFLSGQDITENKRLQEGAAIEKELFRQVIDTDPSLIFVKDRYGNLVLVNQAMADAFGKSAEDVINQSNRVLHQHEDELDAYARVEREVIQTMRPIAVEEDPFTHADGKTYWYRTIKRPLVRASGEVQVLAICTDITDRLEAQREREQALADLAHKAEEARREAESKTRLVAELDRKLAIIEEQSREILSLSVPMLDVGGEILGVPIIGAMNAARAAEVMERLLQCITARRARDVIVDLTGLREVDAGAAEQLMRIVRAVELIGAKVIVTGISPRIAQMIIGLGLDLSQLRTMRTLREALRACQQ